MKKLILCLCILSSFFGSKAQTSIAIVGGLQKASVSPGFLVYPDTLQKSETQKTGAILGIVANIPLSKYFFVRTGVVYSSRGSNWTQFNDTTDLYARTKDLPLNKRVKPFSTNTKLNVNYIDVPLNIMYKLPFKNNSGLVIGVGPQASIFYNGSSTSFSINVSQDSSSESSVRTSVKETQNNDLPVGKLSKTYRIVHFGVNAFVGVEFNRVFFNINYAKALNEFYEEEGRKYKHQTAGLSMGIFLGQRPLAKSKK
jgi:OOP family OmpA-OmpF porin